MNTTTITNATNGAIINVTQFQHPRLDHSSLIILGCIAVLFIGTGLYLLLRKPKPKS